MTSLFKIHLLDAYEKLEKDTRCFLVNGTSCRILEIIIQDTNTAMIYAVIQGEGGYSRWLDYSESGACWHNVHGDEELPCVTYKQKELSNILSAWFPIDLLRDIYSYLPLQLQKLNRLVA